MWRPEGRLAVTGGQVVGLRVGLGDRPSEYLDIVNVLLPPWSAVAHVRELLLHCEHADDAHGRDQRAIECPWLSAVPGRKATYETYCALPPYPR